jgi:RHS repeat-associated protein
MNPRDDDPKGRGPKGEATGGSMPKEGASAEGAPNDNKGSDFVKVPELPAPTLPKGGGAIRGIGEKFQMAAATGTGGMSIPLAFSPGRSGMGPSVGLSYDSGSGNGAFGIGWSLTVPSIRRKTEKGLPRYFDKGESDIFLLSGAEDLVPELEFVSSTWQRTSVTPRNGETIERFRPRIEGLFARIERHTVTATGNVYWVSVTKDNVTSIYGRNANARIADPADATRVFEWLLEATYDDRGNVVYYEYKAEDKAAVAGAPHELHRTSASVAAQRYLKRVHYGNVAPKLGPDLSDSDIQTNTWLFEAVFDYGEHDADAPTPTDSGIWLARQDPTSQYRAGFEVRSYRLCRRVLMFHSFAELGTDPVLVRSTDFTYDEGPSVTYLRQVTQKGYIQSGASYTSKALPAVEMDYQLPVLDDTVRLADERTRRELPPNVDGRTHRWVDLDGEGIAGLLTEERGGALVYRANRGGAALAPPRTLVSHPSPLALADGRQQLLDLASEGRLQLVELGGSVNGFYERTKDDDWERFVAFKALPTLDWNEPNLQFLDLNGDGFADVLRTEGDRLVWYPSRGKDGFGPAVIVPQARDERKGPAVVFADAEMSVHVADMSGDGLSDIVRIRNGEVSYWPNLGYGKFGPRVVMSSAPNYDTPDLFDPKRLRLFDVDGTGTTDIVYLGRSGVRMWFNEAGNGWSSVRPLLEYLPTHDLASIQVADFLGNGTGCLLWMSTAPGDGPTRLRYVDLLSGKKPHLLVATRNNMGLETKVAYASSTKFYLKDKAAGVTWATRLAFPVHVVARVETYELVTKTRFVSTYRYRHGYYDGPEREFRGFGYVEQRDAESYGADRGTGIFPPGENEADGEFLLPPVVTKTWFHTGAWKEQSDIAAVLATEYWSGDSSATVLPRTLFTDLTPESVQDEREAARALKGSALRQEIYAEDGTSAADKPFSVSERCYAVRRLQPPTAGNRFGVYLAHAREVVDYHYERNASDPRVQHAFTLEVDDFGTVLKAAAVGYPRRGSPTLTEQTKLWATLAENEVVHRDDVDTWYRIGIPKEARSYELTGISPPSGAALLAFSAVATAASSASTIAYETAPSSGYEKRLLKQSRAYYFKDDLSAVLALGTVESKALLHHAEALALTGGLISSVYGSSVTSTILTTEGGFVAHGSDYWSTSSVPTYDEDHFYLVTKVTEPFGNRAAVTYDTYDLLAVEANSSETTSALNLTTTFDNDYRVLAPAMVTDPNENRAAVAFDELGMVTKVALMGKSGGSDGDTLSDPTSYFEYDLSVVPTMAHGFARETHGGTPVWQESYSYTAGNGKEVLRKIQARGSQWIGNGRTVWDNKGNPIKQYEPYFAATGAYDAESAIASSGVTAILRYDPPGRLIRTDLPNGTYSKVVFDPWRQETWDPNDTVADSQWYVTNSDSGAPAEMQRAAALALAHAGTPLLAHADSLGRTFRTQQDNGTSSSHVFYDTEVTLDVEGNALAVIDARGNTTLAHTYCPTGTSIQSVSAEAGTSKVLYNIEGVAIRAWNSRDVRTRTEFDAVRRPTHLYVKIGSATEFLAERTVYGEMLGSSTSLAKNMRGRVYRVYDGAGAATHVAYDFKGNLLESNRVLDTDPTTTLDWSPIASATTLSAIESAVTTAGLLGEDFSTTSVYDALNRVISSTTPDTSETLPTYDESNFLKSVAVKIRGASTATTFVRDVTYNARGQRLAIDYAGTSSAAFTTEYGYDPLTFRITTQTTTRESDSKVLQDFELVYDPAGNIVEILDTADQTLFFSGSAPVGAGQQYEYDAIYRITSASGREHPGQTQPVHADPTLATQPHPNNAQAMRAYTETYEYDEVGNILAMLHSASSNNWNRHYTYDTASNKLETTELPGDPSGGPYSATYDHDVRGNMVQMPHLASIGWDWADRMQTCDLGGGGDVYFTYDSSGQRVRKVWQKTSTLRDERIYLGGFELFRTSTSGTVSVERETLHVMDDQRRIAMVETLTIDPVITTPDTRERFQLANQIESVAVELTETGAIIGYEEFYPFGATSFHSANGSLGVSAKRYRYTGKERDEETGLYYHGARYYAAWLGRWAGVDPSGRTRGSRYGYVGNHPIQSNDPDGREETTRGVQPVASRVHSSSPDDPLNYPTLTDWNNVAHNFGPLSQRRLDDIWTSAHAEARNAAAQKSLPQPVDTPTAPPRPPPGRADEERAQKSLPLPQPPPAPEGMQPGDIVLALIALRLASGIASELPYFGALVTFGALFASDDAARQEKEVPIGDDPLSIGLALFGIFSSIFGIVGPTSSGAYDPYAKEFGDALREGIDEERASMAAGTDDFSASVNASRGPSLAEFSSAGRELDAADKAGILTKAGRSLQKHATGSRAGASLFPRASGPPANWNVLGQQQLDDILTNPLSTRTALGRGGTEFLAPDGRGVRFNSDGSFGYFFQR